MILFDIRKKLKCFVVLLLLNDRTMIWLWPFVSGIHRSDLWCFLCCLPERVVEQRVDWAIILRRHFTHMTAIEWCRIRVPSNQITVYPKKYAHGFCFAVLCCGYTLTGFPISIRLTSLALWQSNDCPSASKATLMNMDKYFMWIHYERLHNHNKAKHNKTVCIFLGIYCMVSNRNTHTNWERKQVANRSVYFVFILHNYAQRHSTACCSLTIAFDWLRNYHYRSTNRSIRCPWVSTSTRD